MAKRTTKKAQLSKDLSFTLANHELLLQHILKRLEFGNTIRDGFVGKLQDIDTLMSGHVELSENDKERDRDNKAGKSPKPVNVSVQLAEIQIEEAVTFLLGVLLPDDGMYGAVSDKENQAAANGISNVMNQHATKFKHYAQFSKGLTDIMKYNFGGWRTEWEVVAGKRVGTDQAGQLEVNDEVVAEGNNLKGLDPYNTLWDAAVSPTEVSDKGEFFAVIEVQRLFAIERMLEAEEIFGRERILNSEGKIIQGADEIAYYKPPPQFANSQTGSSNMNWFKVMSAGASDNIIDDANEITHIWIWINPKDFGLKSANESEGKMEIWRFTLINNSHIVAGAEMTNVHGRLPIAISMPIDNALGLQTKSYAEQLLPFQIFASSQLNTHQRANRRALYGLTVFDKSILNLDEVDLDEFEAGIISADLSGRPDKSIDKAFRQFNDTPNTDGTMRDFSLLLDIQQRILPTNSNNQVASLERATQYQAAALVQGTNKRPFKIAKLINDQAVTHVRWMQYHNILQFQDTIEVIDNDSGELIKVTPAEFRKPRIEWALTDGLKGIDKLLVTENIKEVVSMILQSNVAVHKFDIVGIVNYWTSMLGDKTDFAQFEIKDQLDALDPEQRQIAIQLYEEFVAAQQKPAGANPGAE